TPGYWGGIYVHHSNNLPVTLKNTIIRYAGSSDFLKSSDISAAVLIYGNKTPEDISTPLIIIDSNKIEKSAAYGVYIGTRANIAQFTNNLIIENQQQPVRVAVDMLQRIDTTNQMLDNNLRQIYIEGTQLGEELPKNAVLPHNWPLHSGVSYYFEEDFSVYAPLIVSPGTTFSFAQDAGIKISGKYAYLSAVGSAEQPIIFTGDQKIPGYWKGIFYEATESLQNKLHYVTVEYAGAPRNSFKDTPAGIYLDNQFYDALTKVSVKNSEFAYNDGYGFYLGTDSTFETFSNNRVYGNIRGTGVMPLQMVNNLGNSNVFSGNVFDHILLSPALVDKGEVLSSWPDINIPYRISDNAKIRGNVYIESGVTVEIAPGKVIIIEGSKSSINAIGTGKEIRFTKISNPAANEFIGNWGGFIFKHANNIENKFDNVVIESAGAPPFDHLSSYPGAAITISSEYTPESPSALEMTNSKIIDSQGFGIWYDQQSTFDDLNSGSNSIFATKGEYCRSCTIRDLFPGQF
ncbi:MAG: hypothetical protein OEX19_01455, partial [Gammaproteobacteria bacterium]|nr:hypothetical protein [Gammaproteobacteria bacterium]